MKILTGEAESHIAKSTGELTVVPEKQTEISNKEWKMKKEMRTKKGYKNTHVKSRELYSIYRRGGSSYLKSKPKLATSTKERTKTTKKIKCRKLYLSQQERREVIPEEKVEISNKEPKKERKQQKKTNTHRGSRKAIPEPTGEM